jgi:hypothetical protein
MNEFSERFARALLDRYPAWREFIRKPRGEDQIDALYLDVPRGKGDTVMLAITTEQDEVTVSFDGWHDHFGFWPGVTEEEAFSGALDAIDAIVRDESLAVLVTRDGAWKWSSVIAPGEHVEIGEDEVAQITSWSGRFDQSITSKAMPGLDTIV